MNIKERIAKMKEAGADKLQGNGWNMPWKDEELADFFNEKGELKRSVTKEQKMENLMWAVRIDKITMRPSESNKYQDTYLINGVNLETNEPFKQPVNGNIKGLLTRLFLNLDKEHLTDENITPEIQEAFDNMYARFTEVNYFEDIKEEDREVMLVYCGKLNGGENEDDYYHTWTGWRLDNEDMIDDVDVPF